MELKERKRSIDISKLTIEEAEGIANQVGTKTREILDEAADKINKVLNIYSMKAKIAIVLEPLESKPSENNLNSTEHGN